MNWIPVKEFSEITSHMQSLIENNNQDFLIFKHSTRCGASSMAKKVFEKAWDDSIPTFLVLVVEDRPLSNLIENTYKVKHESPQLLLIQNGECTYNVSHSDIDASEITTFLISK